MNFFLVAMSMLTCTANAQPELGINSSDKLLRGGTFIFSPDYSHGGLWTAACLLGGKQEPGDKNQTRGTAFDYPDDPIPVDGDDACRFIASIKNEEWASVSFQSTKDFRPAFWNDTKYPAALPKQFFYEDQISGQAIENAYKKLIEKCLGNATCEKYRLVFITGTSSSGSFDSSPLPLTTDNLNIPIYSVRIELDDKDQFSSILSVFSRLIPQQK